MTKILRNICSWVKSNDPILNFASGIFLIIAFHSIRFWVRQIGILSTIKIPLSLFLPIVGIDLLTAPTVEIIYGIADIHTWKIVLLSVLLTLSIAVPICFLINIHCFKSIKKDDTEESNDVKNMEIVIGHIIFIFLPIFFLPTQYESNSEVAVSVIAALLLIVGFKISKTSIQTTVVLLAFAFGGVSVHDYYEQGKELSQRCQLLVAVNLISDIETKKPNNPVIGCWVSSSDKYITLMMDLTQSPNAKIIPRDQIKNFTFMSDKK